MKRSAADVLALLDEHGEQLYALLVRLTLRDDVAEDLLQDLFCKLVESHRFATATDPRAYAARMAMNLAFDHRRRERRTRCSELNTEAPAGPIASPIADLVRREEFERVLDAIGRLSDTGREIVVLRYLEQHGFEAIAQVLGKTAHQTRALCHKAITQLRRLLGESLPENSTTKGQENV